MKLNIKNNINVNNNINSNNDEIKTYIHKNVLFPKSTRFNNININTSNNNIIYNNNIIKNKTQRNSIQKITYK